MKKGFTLSEVLITLGIVGTIAALTIPSVVSNYKKKVYVAQLKKTYNQIYDATHAIINDEQASNYYATSAGITQTSIAHNCKTGPCYLLNNYFNVAKAGCVADNGNEKQSKQNVCYAKDYKSLSGASLNTTLSGYCIQTTNGVTICMAHNPTNQVTCVVIDVNGTDEPNMAGRDVFSMDIKSDGSVSDYASGSNDVSAQGQDPENCGKISAYEGVYSAASGCLNKIITDGWRMTY